LQDDVNITNKINEIFAAEVILLIPRIVDYEVRRGLRIKFAPAKERKYSGLLERCEILEISEGAWERAIDVYAELYHKRFTVARADILIAATCLEHNCILVTNNTKDFSNVNGLGLADWTV
jgi:tRNA(fMet)-specific endonuclease VapC